MKSKRLDLHPPTMDVCWWDGGIAEIVLGGEHDFGSTARLSTLLTQTLQNCSHLVVNVSTTTFIDSSTIRELVSAKHHADASECGFNLLLGTEPIVERALEITGVLPVLNRVHTLEEALNSTR